MRTKKIPCRDFDFERFIAAMTIFIEANFGTDVPDAADTLRYFYSFENRNSKDVAFKDTSRWEMADFKNAILQGGETIFMPFSGGLNMDGSINLANGMSIRPRMKSNENAPYIGIVDCWGFLIALSKKKFVFKSAIAWGGEFHSIENASSQMIDRKMNGLLKSFHTPT